MIDNKVYFMNREARKIQAQEHTKFVEQVYSKEIQDCVSRSERYTFSANVNVTPNPSVETEVVLSVMGTTDAIFENSSAPGKICALNFASYRNPGGMFYEGSSAQEESLCHDSFLYSVLRQFQDVYYSWNNLNKNKGLYKNRAIYTPGVIFMGPVKAGDNHIDKQVACDIITCASPNWRAASEYGKATKDENTEALTSRIKFIMDIAAANKVDTLILGAFGCGVFRQDPYEVATIFKNFLYNQYAGVFKKVVFAIPDTVHGENLKAFTKVLCG